MTNVKEAMDATTGMRREVFKYDSVESILSNIEGLKFGFFIGKVFAKKYVKDRDQQFLGSYGAPTISYWYIEW